MKISTLFVFVTMAFLSANAQDMKFGLGMGANLSLIHTSSDLSMQNQPDYKPSIGTELGITTAIELSDNTMLLGGFQFLTLRSKSTSGVSLFDASGIYTNENYRHKIQTVNSLLIELNLAYRLNPTLYLGTGANVAIKLSSNTKYVLSGSDIKAPLTFLNPMRFYIPVFLGIDKERYIINLGYRQGIGNRLRDNNSSITESEGHFFINFKVFFGQEL